MSKSVSSHPWGHPPVSCIEIPYRDEGNGGGAFYDHYTVQGISGRETVLSIPHGMTVSALESYVKAGTPHVLHLGVVTAEGKRMPPLCTQTDRLGLLIITGHARETETKRSTAFALRTTHELRLLRRAMNQGRPILGICAGSWQIWGALGGGFRDVKDHAWERMPAITTRGVIGYNTQMHRVSIPSLSMLAGAVADGRKYTAPSSCGERLTPLPPLGVIHPDVDMVVNSVHWKAPDPASLPLLTEGRRRVFICATAKQDDSIAPKKKESGAGAFKHPEEGTVEAFEQVDGAPILGIQWHPEAYNRDGSLTAMQQRSIITYMAKAGDAFCAKQKMLASFELDVVDVVKQLKKMTIS